MSLDARCRACGALLATDASWCGQCYAPVGPPAADVEPPPAPPPPASNDDAPMWPCAVCGGMNPLEADACMTCGTSFARMMRGDQLREAVDPRDAVRRSLLFPGLGHRLLGYPAEGLARGALFTVSVLMAVMIGIAGSATGVATVVFWLFLLTALGAYVFSAVEVDRMARGGRPLIAGKLLMWVVVGEVFLAIIVLALSVVSATRR